MTPAEQVVKARVLLMVERNGRVVRLPSPARNENAARLAATVLGARFARWWLVQAESADAARQIIAAKKSWRGDVLDKSERTLYASPDGTLFEGRILAHGGRNE